MAENGDEAVAELAAEEPPLFLIEIVAEAQVVESGIWSSMVDCAVGEEEVWVFDSIDIGTAQDIANADADANEADANEADANEADANEAE